MGETTVEDRIELIVKGDKFFIPITSQESIVTIEFDGPMEVSKPNLSSPYFSFKRHSATINNNDKEHRIEFKAKRKLESLVVTNTDDCEWIKNKAKEITEGCQTKRELVDRLVEYLSDEVEYHLIKKREIELLTEHFKENYWEDTKGAIKSYLPKLRTRLLVNLKEEMMRNLKPGEFNYKLFNEKKDKVRAEFHIRMKGILLCYEPVFVEGFTEDAENFLNHVGKSWDLFNGYMRDYDYRPKRTIEEGGRCEQKSRAFNALCQELGITGAVIRVYYEGLEGRGHSMSIVKMDEGEEVVDPTQNQTQIKETGYLTECNIEKKDDQTINKVYFRIK